MNDVAQYMNALAAAMRLRQLIVEFQSAVAARDLRHIAATDIALRSAALVLIASVDIDKAEAAENVKLLQEIVDALRDAAIVLSDAAQGSRASLGQKIYMRLGAEGQKRL